jgi:hypothetical protein
MKSNVEGLLRLAKKNTKALRSAFKETGLRVSGFNELLGYMNAIGKATREIEELRPLAFFATRAKQDIEVGIIALYSGMPSIVADAMRDMMEIALLLRQFNADAASLKEWYEAPDQKSRQQRFSPNRLRQLHANRIGVTVEKLRDSHDYASHSQALHVAPSPQVIRRGLVKNPDITF